MATSSADMVPTVLIPAAGFGKRVGSPLAKELLPDAAGKPLIAWALDAIAARGWRAHVITRVAKAPLLAYLAQRQNQGLALSVQLIEDSSEWPDTLLRSQPHWGERNLVVLPDTRFEPLGALDALAGCLARSADQAFALFETPVFSAWGVVDAERRWLCEKPQEEASRLSSHGCKAWGVFGFRRQVGEELLSLLLASTFNHKWQPLSARAEFVRLESFIDLTRGSLF